MRNSYRLVQLNKYEWHLVCPFGQPIAHIRKYAVGILVTPSIAGIGDRQNFRIESDDRRKAEVYEQHPDMEAACRPFVERHYRLNNSLPRRIWKGISVALGNPVWGWLFGAVAAAIAIWALFTQP